MAIIRKRYLELKPSQTVSMTQVQSAGSKGRKVDRPGKIDGLGRLKAAMCQGGSKFDPLV